MGVLAEAVRIMRGEAAPRPAAGGLAGPVPAARGVSWLGALSLTDEGLQLTDSERSFASQAVAYQCVMLIAQNLSAIDMVVLAGDAVDEGDPIAALWNAGTPGASYSARVVREVLFARLELKGEAFAFIDRGPTGAGPAVGLHPIWDTVKVVIERDQDRRLTGRIAGYIVKTSSGEVPLLPTEVLWLRYPHPTERWGSLAPWKAALYAVESDAYARAWQRNEFKNGARPSQVIDLGTVTPEQYQSALAAIRSRVDGASNAGKSLVVGSELPGKSPAKVQHLSLTPAEMSYLESRTANADEVMMAFGVNPDLLRAGSTYENRAAAKTALWSEKLLPKLDTLASEVDRQLVPEPARQVGWDLSEVDALRESQNAVIKRASDATYPDIVTIDEARAMIGLDPLPGGVGAYTLTPYRERARLTAQADFLAVLGGVEGARSVRLIRHAGRTRAVGRVSGKPRTKDSTLAAYDRHERIGRRAIARLADRQLKAVLRELKAKARAAGAAPLWPERRGQVMPWPGAPVGEVIAHDTGQRMSASDLFDVTFWTAETRRALEDFMDGTWSEGGEYAAARFGLNWDTLSDDVLEQMARRLDVLAAQMSETTRAAIEAQILQEGVLAGESIDDLADRLRSVFGGLSTWRATTIARTEVVGGYNAAAHRVAVQSGVVVTRRWLATSDSRTRPSHARLDGHVLDRLDESYPNGCRFPGDPQGPASETVNCRCVELFDTDAPDRAYIPPAPRTEPMP